ncbi:hypothetical protein PPYR_15667 [Photinus pyralis]|uniref:Uncharacterized protein n=1 Tax=Photinus pyralis TaxID=7054 RepID=A0A5N4A081_PHOPY|nr:hypothetical protein PPYR_15667 [Photinus pyralis]
MGGPFWGTVTANSGIPCSLVMTVLGVELLLGLSTQISAGVTSHISMSVVVPAKECVPVSQEIENDLIGNNLYCPDFDVSLLEEVFGDLGNLKRQLIEVEQKLSRFFKILFIKRQYNYCDLKWCECQTEQLIQTRMKLLADIQQFSDPFLQSCQ